MLTIFQVLMNEKWTQVMYDTFRCSNSMFPSELYYVFLVLGGNIIMLKLLLAILLGNFEKARDYGEKKKILDAFQEMKDDGLSLNQAMDLILGDLSFHTKVRVLGWDPVIVQQAHLYGETQLALAMMEEQYEFDSELFDDHDFNESIDGLELDLDERKRKLDEASHLSRVPCTKFIAGDTLS